VQAVFSALIPRSAETACRLCAFVVLDYAGARLAGEVITLLRQ
jgi:hypothetical protein